MPVYQTYWYVFVIASPIIYFVLRPVADGVIKLLAIISALLGIYGLLLVLGL